MTPILGIVHFTRAAIAPINDVFGRRLGGDAEILNFLDEAILRLTLQHGPLDPGVLARLERLLVSAEEAGACVIVSSGSSLSPAVDRIAGCVQVPVLKIETQLAEEAAARYKRVVVLVTKQSNVAPFQAQLAQAGRGRGASLHVRFDVHEAAFDALIQNDPDRHDEIVLEALAASARTSPDAILLPQVSVARILDRLPADLNVPVLSSVHVAVDRIVGMVRGNRAVYSPGTGAS